MAVELQDIAVDPGEHVVQFYEHDGQLVHSVGGYLAGAVEEGSLALAITTEAHRHMFEAELVAAGLEPDLLRLDGALVFLDASATLARFLRDGHVDHHAFDQVVGSVIRRAATARPVRAYGEMVAVLWEAGNVLAAIELEEAWNGLIRDLPLSLVCGYRSESVQSEEHAEALHHVCALHSAVVPAGDRGVDAAPVCADFPPDREAPRSARHFVTNALRRWGQFDGLVDDAQLVVTELATNAVLHARSQFSVELHRQEGGVRVAVRDASIDQPVVRRADPLVASGRGLRLVAALAAGWGVVPEPGGKIIWAELRA